jgi:hypothetical protein
MQPSGRWCSWKTSNAEPPADTLKNTLARHVVRPPLWAMVLVTIAFDSQTLVAPSLNNHIDAVPHGANLGRDVVATLQQPAKNFALEVFGRRYWECRSQSTTSSNLRPNRSSPT